MSLAIEWTDEAKETFAGIVSFIENKWTDREAKNFVKRAQKLISLIAVQPYMYKASLYNDVRQAVITPQTSTFYQIHPECVTILFFWDNRQEPIF